MEKESVTINVPAGVMDGMEYIKLERLAKTGLEIADNLLDEGDNTAKLLWPILQTISDLCDQYPGTDGLLFNVAQAIQER